MDITQTPFSSAADAPPPKLIGREQPLMVASKVPPFKFSAVAATTEKNRKIVHVGVVGRGFAGVKQLYEIASGYTPQQGIRLMMTSIDVKTPEHCGGAAYSDADPLWSLNVPNIKMSAESDNPEGFVTFLRTHQKMLKERYPGITVLHALNDYSSRVHYQAYLYSLLQRIQAIARNKGIILNVLTGTVTDVIPEKSIDPLTAKRLLTPQYSLPNGTLGLTAPMHTLVLSIGNAAPEPIPMKRAKIDPRVLQEPLKQIHTLSFSADAVRVIIRGFGNTAVDLALKAAKLAKEKNVDLRILALQKYNDGILVHPSNPKLYPADIFKKAPATADGLWHALVTALADTSYYPDDLIKMEQDKEDHLVAAGFTAQDVGDSLRTVFNPIWAQFSEIERKKWQNELRLYQGKSITADALYRHIRNRTVPNAASQLRLLIRDQILTIAKGELTAIISEGSDKPLEVKLTLKDKEVTFIGSHLFVFNAAGPCTSLSANPLIRRLQNHKLATEFSPDNPYRLQNRLGATGTDDPTIAIYATDYNTAIKEKFGTRELGNSVLEIAKQITTFIQTTSRVSTARL